MGNILGNPFDPWVKKQIEIRQESLGKYSNIPSKDLQYYTTKTPFIRFFANLSSDNNDSGIPKFRSFCNTESSPRLVKLTELARS